MGEAREEINEYLRAWRDNEYVGEGIEGMSSSEMRE